MNRALETMPTVVDLFCGAGGFALGFQAAGCLNTAAVDADQQAGKTFDLDLGLLQPSRPPTVFAGEDADIEQLDLHEVVRDYSPPDILIGGPRARHSRASGAPSSIAS